ncbi:MAG: type II toxin-antitoxin system VapC family toxin [Bacteroidia bacterium]
MDILLDTHAVIWFITENASLPVASKEIISNPANRCFVSMATYWEMGIKYSLDRLELKNSLERIFEIIEESGFEILPITPEHVLLATQLIHYHRDPFDRMIIGQAKSEGLKIMTKDALFSNYGVDVIWEK